MKKIAQTLFILLIAFVISGCGESSPYPVIESGVKPGISYRILWLDNERVLFSGKPKQSKNLTNPEWVGKQGLYIWNTRDKSVSQYKAGYYVPGCFHEGHILYSAPLRGKALDKYRKDARTHVKAPHWEGMFGEETYRTHYNDYLGEKQDEKTWRNPINCHLTLVPEDAKGTIQLLLEDGEYIDRSGTHMGKESFVFHSEKKGIRKELPLPVRTTYKTIYVPFDGRHFIHTIFPDSMYESCRYGQCLAVWWVDREGNTEKALLPKSQLPYKGSIIHPMIPGYFVVSHSVSSGKGGGYLVSKEGSSMKIIEGFVRNAAVSPDGCKVAFNHYYKEDDLKVIDFCSTN